MEIRTREVAALLLLCGCENPSVTQDRADTIYSQGVITAKGSAWVDGAEASEDDLKVGMAVGQRADFDPYTAQWKARTVVVGAAETILAFRVEVQPSPGVLS